MNSEVFNSQSDVIQIDTAVPVLLTKLESGDHVQTDYHYDQKFVHVVWLDTWLSESLMAEVKHFDFVFVTSAYEDDHYKFFINDYVKDEASIVNKIKDLMTDRSIELIQSLRAVLRHYQQSETIADIDHLFEARAFCRLINRQVD